MKCEKSCRILKTIFMVNFYYIGNMDSWQNIYIFFYVNNSYMKCEESCCILKIIYHGFISAIENMDGWLNNFFFFFMLTFHA